MSIYDLLLDFGCASILILIGQFLRSKIKFFQNFFVPASLIAGFLGLFLGPKFLNIMPFSGNIGSYAGAFIIVIFTAVGVNGFDIEKSGGGKETVKRLIGYEMFRQVGFALQIAVPILITILVLCRIWPNLNPGFGILLASGFDGGHGTAAAVGKTFAGYGWEQATDLAITFATVGILIGIFGGLILIKLATKKGWTNYAKDFSQLNSDLRTGLVAKERRTPLGMETISSVSLDTLCFHMSLLMVIAGGAYLLNQRVLSHFVKNIPDFTLAYLIGLLFFILFHKTPLYSYVDTRVNTRISGMFTDYLVCFAVASINPTVLVEYAGPMIVMCLIGLVLVTLVVLPFGYLMNRENWFEHAIFCFGYLTGVFAIGFVLLRIVDPENKSLTVDDTAMTPFMGFVEMFIWSAGPAMLVSGQGMQLALGTAIFGAVSIGVSFLIHAWYPAQKYPLSGRKPKMSGQDDSERETVPDLSVQSSIAK
jgi:ESS family glutamate:Na+ symporter